MFWTFDKTPICPAGVRQRGYKKSNLSKVQFMVCLVMTKNKKEMIY